MRIADTCPCGAQIDVTHWWPWKARATHHAWVHEHLECRVPTARQLLEEWSELIDDAPWKEALKGWGP